MTGFFLREDKLSKTMEPAGLVPPCLDHSLPLSEQDEQGKPQRWKPGRTVSRSEAESGQRSSKMSQVQVETGSQSAGQGQVW